MEIERKWMVNGWPDKNLPLVMEHRMRQGYVSVEPTVRIREEALRDGETKYILCFKSTGRLARKEIEIEISSKKFEALEDLIELPLIVKVRRTYQLSDGMKLEVNHVDEGLPTEFWYAEVEYESIEQARCWNPADVELASYLDNDVTEMPGQSMGTYWIQTRMQAGT